MSVEIVLPSGQEATEPKVDRYALKFVVDLDERGSFQAHVENCTGKTIFSFTNEDENGWPGDLWLVDAGYMRHSRDVAGLIDYLLSVGMVGANATLTVEG